MKARSLHAGLALLLCFAAPWAGAQSMPLAATDHACAYPGLTVRGGSQSDVQDACAGSQDALAFFSTLGLAPDKALRLEIVSHLPETAGPTAVGCYLEAEKRILLVPYSEFRKARTWFKQPIDRVLYRSLAAHETAHAVAACAFAIANPTIQAKEYLAYVAMLSAMPTTLRERVLRAYPDAAFASDDRITAVFYMFEPMAFGVAAWRHYAQADKGPAFLKAVLAGHALTD